MRTAVAVLAAGIAIFGIAPVVAQDSFTDARIEMVATIEDLANAYIGASEGGPIDPKVLDAMRTVPRHEFVPEDMRPFAYENRPLPIGNGQTISQPFIVAMMTDIINPQPQDRVLEIGTGSGYQAAVLSSLVDKLFTIEIVQELGEQARATLERLGYANVETRIGDGYNGWPEEAPFDAIVVTAAPDQIPAPLIEQLAPGGRMIIPVSQDALGEELTLVEKRLDGTVTSRPVMPVRFVPFTRENSQ